MTIWLVCVCRCVCTYVCVCLRGRRDSCIGSGIDLHAEKSQGLFDYTRYSAALRSLALNSQTAFNCERLLLTASVIVQDPQLEYMLFR